MDLKINSTLFHIFTDVKWRRGKSDNLFCNMYFKYYYRIRNDIIWIHWQKTSSTLAYDADGFLWNLCHSD